MTDVQLLDRFVGENDEASFDALMARHGPQVLRVCRKILSDPHDVDDAYQATFLILLRKAADISDPQALGNWLHGVAHRVSLRLRRDSTRRRDFERKRAEMDPPIASTPRPWDDLDRAVREELGALPETYRTPLELCYLRGRSHEQAASDLGWPLGTLKTRILRGRKRLRDRLDRRGITIGVGLLLLFLRHRGAIAAPSGMVGDPTSPSLPADEPATGPTPAPRDRAPELLTSMTGSRRNLLWIALIALTLLFAASRAIAFFSPSEPLGGC